jgi:hypothetical protein
MPNSTNNEKEFCPEFDQPPVIETRVIVQFKPLSGVRAVHYGLFLQQCLGSDWHVVDDLPPVSHEQEKFGSLFLNPPADNEFGDIDSLALQTIYRSSDERSTVHFQPDRLTYSYSRQGSPRPSFTDLRSWFDPLMARWVDFARKEGLGEVVPDLWEVSYTNVVPQGDLWQNPSDWHKVFPKLFPAGGIDVAGHEWSTFDGEWYFNIPDNAGRVRVKARKAVNPQKDNLVLLLGVRARGPLGPGIKWSWSEALNLGHRSAVRVFYDLASDNAKAAWGYRT